MTTMNRTADGAFFVTLDQLAALGVTTEAVEKWRDGADVGNRVADAYYRAKFGEPEFTEDGALLHEDRIIDHAGTEDLFGADVETQEEGEEAMQNEPKEVAEKEEEPKPEKNESKADTDARAKKRAEEAKQYGDVLRIVQEDAEMTALPAWQRHYTRASNLRINADETWQDLKGDDLVKQRGIKLAWPILVDAIAQHVKNLNECAARYPLFFAEHGMCTAEFNEKTGVVTIKDPVPACERKAVAIAKEATKSQAKDDGETGGPDEKE